MTDTTIPPEGRIRGDLLLLALQFLEKSYASYIRDPFGDDQTAPIWDALTLDLAHPYNDAHWYGEIALRTPSRRVLEMLMTHESRHDAIFSIKAVAQNAIDEMSGPDVFNGLSDEDRKKLIKGFSTFLSRVASGKISRDILRNS